MRISKYFKKICAMTMLGTMVVTMPVMAKTNDVKISSSVDVDLIKDLMECQVYDYEVDSLYEDRAIRAYAKSYNEEGFIVLDEKRLVDKFGMGLEDENGNFFYYGIKAVDSYINPSKEIFVCKCDQADFNSFANSLPSNFRKSSDTCYDCYWNNGDYTSVIYDSINGIIMYSYYSSTN